MFNATYRILPNASSLCERRSWLGLGTWLARTALVALGVTALGIPNDANAQGTKRLGVASTGHPWDGCSDLEGFVVDEPGQYTVQSARCKGVFQIWLLKVIESAGGEASRPQVIDQLSARPLRPGETLSAGPYCTVRKREIRWVAIYKWKGRSRIAGNSGGVVDAWSANLQTGRLEPVPRSKILKAVCTTNPGE